MPDIFDEIAPDGQERTGDVFDRIAAPTVTRVPQWDDIRARLPEDIQATHGNRVKNALSISAALDMPLSLSYDMHDSFTEKFKESNLWDKAQGSFKAGIGDVYSTIGNTMKWLGYSDEAASVYLDFGERLRAAYIPPIDQSEFTWGKMKDPEWWATTGVRSVPFTLSLIPAAIVGAYGGVAAAGAAGLGAFGTTVLGAIGGAALSRPVESAFEAGGAYEEALSRGMSEEEANAAANKVFMGNMALTGVDAAQFALAFTPLKVLGKSANQTLSRRVLATTGRLAGVGVSEALEERYQETISGKALGDDISFFDLNDPRLNEASALGAIFGVGLGGAGSAWTGLTNHVVNTMPEDMRAEYDAQRAEGKTDIQALDAIAETPDGKQHIEGAIEALKKATEDTRRPEVSEAAASAPETVSEPIPDLTTDEAAIVEQSTIETDEATETAAIDLIIEEGATLETLTDEQIAARAGIEVPEGPTIAETTPALPETGVTPEQSATALLEGERAMRIVTDEMYQDALRQWKEKTSGVLRSGIDPTLIAPLVTMGAYHVESGARTFKKWSEQMVKEFGEQVRPMLQDIWKQSRDYLKAQQSPRVVKKQIGLATGVKKISRLIREDQALAAAWKKAEQNSRIAFREGKKEALAKAKAQMQEVVAEAKRKAAEKIAAIKAKAAEKKIYQREQDEQDAKIAKDIKTLKKLKKKSNGKIAVEYQEAIRLILEGIDFKKPTDDTVLRLTALHDYIIKNGVPLGISQAELNQLQRLSQVAVRDISPEALSGLAATVKKLYDLGKLKKQLMESKKGRERQAALDALIESTHNLDPQMSGKDEPTRSDIIKAGAARTNMEILHTFRVADNIDGIKDYGGANATMIQEEMRAEMAAKNEANRRSRGLIEKILAVKEELTEEEQAKITIVLMVEQGASSQAQALMEKYGYTQVPVLTEQERAITGILRESVGEKTGAIAALYEQRETLAFPEVKNYFPIKYEEEVHDIPVPDLIMQDRHRTRQVEQGFTVARVPNVTKTPRIDFLKVAEEAITAQEWYLTMQPVIDEHAALIRTPEYREAAGSLATAWWKDHVDIVARRGWSATARGNPLLRMARLNLNQAVLGYKLTTVIMQPFAVFDAVAYATSRWGLTAGKDIAMGFGGAWINPKAAMAYIKDNPALNLRQAGEIAIEETMEEVKGRKGAYARFKRGAMSGIRIADIITAAGVQKGFIEVLKKHSVKNAEAEAEAEFLMNLTNGSSEVTARPHILARGEGARLWLTFQTFFLNRWGVIWHDLIKTGYSGNWGRRSTVFMGLLILIAGGVGEDKARELLGLLMGGKEDEEGFWKKVFMFIPRQLPAIGGLFEKWGKAEPPLIQKAGQAAKGVRELGEGKPIAGIADLTESVLTVVFGVPGTTQAFDLLDAAALKEMKKEERKKGPRARVGG